MAENVRNRMTAAEWEVVSSQFRELAELQNKVVGVLAGQLLQFSSDGRQDACEEVRYVIDQVESVGFQSLAYMTSPQSEWVGGNKFVTRDPHIVKVIHGGH